VRDYCGSIQPKKQATSNNIQPMASLNFEQWHEWSTQIQDEHSKLNNTECCVCYSYEVLNKNVCGQCKNYVCHECSDKLQHNECPICRTSGIVKDRQIEPRENDIAHEENTGPRGILTSIGRTISFLYNDYMEFVETSGPDVTRSREGYMEFERNYRRRHLSAGRPANHRRFLQQRVAATQNTSPYVSDDSWLGAQGYIRGSVDMPTGGYGLHGTDENGVYTSRHAYYHPLTPPPYSVMQNNPANMVAMTSLSQMHNNIISHL
jgi:hypothetical protein